MPSKTQQALERARKASSKLREYKAGEASRAGMNGAMVLGGSAISGAALAAAGEDIAGIPTDAGLALVGATAGAVLGSPALIYMAIGMAAPYVQSWTREALEGAMPASA